MECRGEGLGGMLGAGRLAMVDVISDNISHVNVVYILSINNAHQIIYVIANIINDNIMIVSNVVYRDHGLPINKLNFKVITNYRMPV